MPESKGIYIAEYLLVVLSVHRFPYFPPTRRPDAQPIFQPCAFIAAVYVLLGRLALHLNAGQYLFIKPHLITRLFIASDVTTFLIQVCPLTTPFLGTFN
jgi:hypothetical protein